MAATVVVTGATGGLGRAVALDLARGGARVLVVGRDAARGAETVRLVVAAGGVAELVLGDVSTRAGVEALGARLRALAPTLDVLVNNAGATFAAHTTTPEGLEATFALDTLGPYRLERALLPSLVAARGRVVNVATGFLDWFPVEVDELAAPTRWSGNTQYGRAKCALVQWTVEAATLDDGVTRVALHPGIVLGTGFGGGQGAVFQAVAGPVMRAVGLACTLEESVRRFRVAALGEVPTGSYLVNGRVAPLPKTVRDPEARRRVVGLLERLA